MLIYDPFTNFWIAKLCDILYPSSCMDHAMCHFNNRTRYQPFLLMAKANTRHSAYVKTGILAASVARPTDKSFFSSTPINNWGQTFYWFSRFHTDKYRFNFEDTIMTIILSKYSKTITYYLSLHNGFKKE